MMASPFKYGKKARRRMRKSAGRLTQETLDKWKAYPETVEALKRASKSTLKLANSHRKKRIGTAQKKSRP
jgi:hypothetical protein